MKEHEIAIKEYREMLETLRDNNITTLKELNACKDTLCPEFWKKTQGYIESVVVRSRTRRTKNGRITPGNAAKLRVLLRYGYAEEQVVDELLLHVISKADKYLMKKPGEITAYVYTTADHRLDDLCRKAAKELQHTGPSLDQPVGGDDGLALQDVLAAECTAEDELLRVEEEMLRQRTLVRRRKACREVLCYAISIFPEKPAMAMALVTKLLGLKPREVAAAFAKSEEPGMAAMAFLSRACKSFSVSTAEVKELLNGRKIQSRLLTEDLKLEKTPDKTAGVLSRKAYRAHSLIRKYEEENDDR